MRGGETRVRSRSRHASGASNQAVMPPGTFGGNNVQAYGTATLALNTWSHLATTYDGTTLRLFLNGTQVNTLAQTGTIATSDPWRFLSGTPPPLPSAAVPAHS